jgi:hypothetical protein
MHGWNISGHWRSDSRLCLGFVSNIFSKECSVNVDTARSPMRNERSGSVPCVRKSCSGFWGWKNARCDPYRRGQLGASYGLRVPSVIQIDEAVGEQVVEN